MQTPTPAPPAAPKKRRSPWHILLIAFLALALVATIGILSLGDRGGTPSYDDMGVSLQETVTTLPREVHATVLFAGDTIMHLPVVEAARTGDGFDFTQSFQYIKPYVEQADLAVVNLEAPLVESNYTGFPTFRCPSVFARDLASLGFDVALCAHNHTNDAGEEGILHTIDKVREAGMLVGGIRGDESEPRYVLTKAGDIDVAIVAYTYGGGSAANRDLNGNPLSAGALPLVNAFNQNDFEEDLPAIKETVQAARAAGADIVIMYYHWGVEYQTNSHAVQQTVAARTVEEMDVDVIIGSHPHVSEERATISRAHLNNEDGGKAYSGLDEVEVYYSMGNLISNQRRAYMSTRCTEEGYLVQLDIGYDVANDRLLSLTSSTIPYWEDMSGSGPSKYMIIPLVEGYESNEYLQKSGHAAQATQALDDIQRILAGEKVR